MSYFTDDQGNEYGLDIEQKLFHLTIHEAAELVVLEMWASGEISEIEEPDDWDGEVRNPKLLILLKDEIHKFEQKILGAVDSGRLKAKNIIRDFEENLIKDAARVSVYDLEDWLSERNFDTGDIFHEWKQTESEIAYRVSEEFDYLRASSRERKRVEDFPNISDGPVRENELDGLSIGNLKSAYKALVISHDRLARLVYSEGTESKEQVVSRVEKPLTTRNRRTLLTLIAALSDYSGIDYKSRGAAMQISRLTDDIGASVTDDTIRSLLADIPDALEARMK